MKSTVRKRRQNSGTGQSGIMTEMIEGADEAQTGRMIDVMIGKSGVLVLIEVIIGVMRPNVMTITEKEASECLRKWMCNECYELKCPSPSLTRKSSPPSFSSKP